MVNKLIACDVCKNEQEMSTVKIKDSEVVISGKRLTLSFFSCPKCNKIYVVFLSDDKMKSLMDDLEETKKRLQRNNGSNNLFIVEKLTRLIKCKQEKVNKRYKELSDYYRGTFTFDTSENNVKERKIIYLP